MGHYPYPLQQRSLGSVADIGQDQLPGPFFSWPSELSRGAGCSYCLYPAEPSGGWRGHRRLNVWHIRFPKVTAKIHVFRPLHCLPATASLGTQKRDLHPSSAARVGLVTAPASRSQRRGRRGTPRARSQKIQLPPACLSLGSSLWASSHHTVRKPKSAQEESSH